ncbi:MAG: hypothetical protein U0V48_06340 [Anaerolineales bacterium]
MDRQTTRQSLRILVPPQAAAQPEEAHTPLTLNLIATRTLRPPTAAS